MLSEIIKGMSNAAEIINENFKKVQEKEDTGWQTLELMGLTSHDVKIRKMNGIVYIFGTVEVEAVINSTALRIAYLEDKYLPYRTMQFDATANRTWGLNTQNFHATLTLFSDGKFDISKTTERFNEYYLEIVYPAG